MKHLKPYNKIYSMMCGVVVFPCVSVYSCNSCFASCWIIVCYRYVFKRCLKICSHIYHVFRSFFFHAFFCLFLFQTDTFFLDEQGLVLCTSGPRDSIRQLILGAYARLSRDELEISARDIVDTYLSPRPRDSLFHLA